MQKEQTQQQNTAQAEESVSRATPETLPNESGGTGEPLADALQTGMPKDGTDPSDANDLEAFEALIKGPYKAAFTAKVQGIINKRFKEEKQKANPPTTDEESGEPAAFGAPTTAAAEGSAANVDTSDPAMQALLKAGIDPQTAYRALHFDEIVDTSARYAASMAAKQLADSIRLKGVRPVENGTLEKNGFAPHRGAAGLTPEKRREMAEKALMGHHIGF